MFQTQVLVIVFSVDMEALRVVARIFALVGFLLSLQNVPHGGGVEEMEREAAGERTIGGGWCGRGWRRWLGGEGGSARWGGEGGVGGDGG